ncbi:hypothetical protein BDR03DRAFT_730422 [Suillus americanus]|nr:hypothetical protein BDR03DRAFT_730422 [Suillus americanus]
MLVSLVTVLSHLRGVHVHAFRCPSVTLSQTKSSSSTTPSHLPPLAVILLLMKLLQSQTNSRDYIGTRRHEHSSKADLKVKPRHCQRALGLLPPRNSLLLLLVPSR